jgi:hypothetical protein
LSQDIDFGATGVEEVFQNVKYILLTEYFSVPLDREFGMDFTMVDKPIPIAEAMLTQEIAIKISLYEPRCQFTEINFEGKGIEGKLNPLVTINILSTNELPSRYPSTPTTPQEVQTAQAVIYASEFPSFIDFLASLSKGPEGPSGLAATVDCGETYTGEAGTQAIVENVGDIHNAVFEFTIPKGDQGIIGPTGIPAYTFSVSDFTIPAVGETVVVEAEDVSWATIGEFLWVEMANGVEAGSLKIVDIDVVENLLTLENPDVSEGAIITYVAARTWNTIGNPNFEVDQRLNGEIQVAGNFVSDRWSVQGTPGLDNKWKAYITNIPQVPSIVPGGKHRVSSKALAVQVLTPLATLDRSDNLHIRTVVEGCSARGIFDAPESSLSLLVMLWNSDWYSTTPLKFGITIRDCNQSNTLAKLCEVNGTEGSSTTAWTYIRLPKLPRLSETYDYINPGVVGYHVDICLAAGVDRIAPQNDLWLPSNYDGALGQDNFLESARTFYITFVQHEPGPYCTPFLEKDFLTNIDECYRYYCKSYPYEIKPGTVSGAGELWFYAAGGGFTMGNWSYPLPMAKSPTVKIYNTTTGAINSITSWPQAISYPIAGVAASAKQLSYISGTTIVAAQSYRFQATADTMLF